MAPLHRSFSLPVKISNSVSRLKALSGAAGKDEVSFPQVSGEASPPSLPTPSEGATSPILSSSSRPSLGSRRKISFTKSETANDHAGSKAPPNQKNSPSSGSMKLWSKGSISSLSGKFKKQSLVDTVDDGKNLDGEAADADLVDKERGRSRFKRAKSVSLTKKEDKLTETVPSPLPPNSYPLTSAPSRDNVTCDDQATNLILGAIDRGRPSTPTGPADVRKLGNTGNALAGLGRRTATASNGGVDTTTVKTPEKTPASTPSRASFLQSSKPVGRVEQSLKRRAPSPFFRARRARDQARAREKSPEVQALSKDNYAVSEPESAGGQRIYRPQVSAYEDDSGSEDGEIEAEADAETEDESAGIVLPDDDEGILDEDGKIVFDRETEENTEANALFYERNTPGLERALAADEMGEHRDDSDNRSHLDYFGEEVEQDPLGEGPNVVVPPQSLFAFSSNTTRTKKTKPGLELITSRPVFARDRCTITLTQGDPDGALEENGKRMRRYVVLSDLSEESRYAIEWAVGTVARDGDELFVISVKEDESKIDPKSWSNADKTQKMRVQKERQTTSLLLVKQVTGLLQRTRLQITVTCQFVHAKNARHMLLDLIDFLEPTMAIVGSRGLGKLQGILLGSTSHYLVQKSSVPVMVARRRLLRPLRKTNPANLRHSPRVSLASASIEKTASSKQEDDVVDVAQEEGTAGEATIAR
nr:hypothetical protein L204_05460 [Cryptococcus depauperatus CBS 7855]